MPGAWVSACQLPERGVCCCTCEYRLVHEGLIVDDYWCAHLNDLVDGAEFEHGICEMFWPKSEPVV
jgi:hypothetical protein